MYIQSAPKFGAGRIKKTQLDREKYIFFNFLEKNHIRCIFFFLKVYIMLLTRPDQLNLLYKKYPKML